MNRLINKMKRIDPPFALLLIGVTLNVTGLIAGIIYGLVNL